MLAGTPTRPRTGQVHGPAASASGGRPVGAPRTRTSPPHIAATAPRRPTHRSVAAAAATAPRPPSPSPPPPPPRRDQEPDDNEREAPSTSFPSLNAPVGALDDKEVSRRFRRTWFDHEDWRNHRSTGRYLRHLASLPGSRIVRSLGPPLAWVVFAGAATGTYETIQSSGALPPFLPSIAIGAQGAAQLSGFALSLLLAARTTNAYGRWLDAVTAVGTVSSRAVDFTRQLAAWVALPPPSSPSPEPAASAEEATLLAAAAARWAAALPRALAAHVREDLEVGTLVAAVLTPAEAAACAASPHPPRFALQALTEVAAAAQAAGRLSDAQAARLDEGLTAAGDAVGVCERIFHMPLPLSSTRHNSRVLMLALTFLPAVLWPDCGWISIPAAVLVAFLLLGIEEVGVSIEEPLSILPLEQMWEASDGEIGRVRGDGGAARALVAASMRGGGGGEEVSNGVALVGAAPVAAGRRRKGLFDWSKGGGGE